MSTLDEATGESRFTSPEVVVDNVNVAPSVSPSPTSRASTPEHRCSLAPDDNPETSSSGETCVSHSTEVAMNSANAATTTPVIPETRAPPTTAHIVPQQAIPSTQVAAGPGPDTSLPMASIEPCTNGHLPAGSDASRSTAGGSPGLDTFLPRSDGGPSLNASPSAVGSGPDLNASPSTSDSGPSLDVSPSTTDSGPSLNASPSTAGSGPNLNASSSTAGNGPSLDVSPSTAGSGPNLDVSPSTAGSGPSFDVSPSTASSGPICPQMHPPGSTIPSVSNEHGEYEGGLGTRATSAEPTDERVPNISTASLASRSHQQVSLVDLNLNTYAGRNPSRVVIEPKHSTKKPSVGQMTKMLRKEAKDRAHKALMEAIKKCIERREKDVVDLAEAHDKTEQYIRKLINDESHYHQKRGTNLFNAKVHWKSQELNEDRPRGNRILLTEVLKGIEEDPTLGDDISEGRKEELLLELREHRKVNAKGARVDNRAANHDYQHTVSQMNQEMSSLSLRTGAIGFAVFTRGHINDSIFASWSTANGAEEFILEALSMTLGELGRKFDAWSVARSQREEEKQDSIHCLQSECARIILEGLKEKLNKPTAHMSYANYHTDIRLTHRIQLRGWPKDIEFSPPASITPKANVLLLRDALKEGECIWVSMTAREVADLKTKLKDNCQRKPRATRKDKGGTHNVQKGKRKRNDENVDPNHSGPPAKKAKGARKKAQLPPQRPPPVDSSSDDSDGV